jgi:hypothetical protein
MKVTDLLKKLDSYDRQGGWLITTGVMRQWFPEESAAGLMSSLRRHADNGLITPVSKGIYANDRAHSKPPAPLEHVVGFLRDGHISYLSLESRLSELGLLSQMPMDLLTVMTTGRSALFNTPYGQVEFIHTKKSLTKLSGELTQERKSPLLRASRTLALRDIKRVGRNVELVMQSLADHDSLEDDDEEYSL